MTISSLIDCYCKLRDRVLALESKPDIDTDEQTISLSGNIITLSSGVTGGGGTIDLSNYLDNTDDQQIQTFSLVGSILTLTLEDGGTQTVDLSSINTDDQLLSLVGNNLSIEDGNTIDLSTYLDDTNAWFTNGTSNPHDGVTGNIHHNGEVHIGNGSGSSTIILNETNSVATVPDIKFNAQGLIQSESNQFYHSQTGNHQFIGGNTGGTTGSTPLVDFNQTGEVEFNQYGSGTFTGTPAFDLQVTANGDVIEVPVTPAPTLNVTKEIEILGFASARGGAGSATQERNSTTTPLGTGLYQATFDSNHPDGNNYEVLTGVEEVGNLRDVPKFSVIDGTKTAGGFQFQITVDDNGGAADTLTLDNWSWLVVYEKEIVTDVALV